MEGGLKRRQTSGIREEIDDLGKFAAFVVRKSAGCGRFKPGNSLSAV